LVVGLVVEVWLHLPANPSLNPALVEIIHRKIFARYHTSVFIYWRWLPP
jgi:hypothetical protein